MFGRSALLMGPRRGRSLTPFLALVALLVLPAVAPAHSLLAEHCVLPDGRVQVESWFDITGDPAKGAGVKVYGLKNELLFEGKLDNDGLLVFTPPRAEGLRIVVSAGAGHRKELRIAAEELPPDGSPPSATSSEPPSPALPRTERSTEIPWRDVFVGVGFLLALAAFLLSVRNARHLNALQQRRQEGG